LEVCYWLFETTYIKRMKNIVSASVGTALEQNQQQLNSQLLNKFASIANKCPLSDGNAVYQARTLLQIIKNQYMEFTDSCDADKPSVARLGKGTDNESDYVEVLPNNFLLFPNPNNGEFNVLYNLNDKQSAIKVSLFDVAGKLVYQKELDTTTNFTSLNTIDLMNGIYHCIITDAKDIQLYTNKLVIIK
jgi:hypothetical protein